MKKWALLATAFCVPVLAFGPGVAGRSIGRRDTFADIGATVAGHLGLPWDGAGHPFL